MQKIINFNRDWKFHFGDIVSIRNRWAWGKSGSFNQGPESRAFDDSQWKNVVLPHDFVFETDVYDYSKVEFDEDNVIPAMENVNNIHTTAGSFDKNVGWYRKHFFIPEEFEGKRLVLEFGGIYRDCRIFLNEFFIGEESDGYTNISIDISDCAAYGEDNILVVRADAREAEGWFYEGGGIYRDVRLVVTESSYIDNLFVHCDYKDGNGSLTVTGDIVNKTDDLQLMINILDTDGNEVAAFHDFCRNEIIKEMKPWSAATPYLYTLRASLTASGREIYSQSIKFGARSIRFDCDKGFLINGNSEKLKGVCCHQNHGGLGAAVPMEVFRYRVKKLKEMGANAYRCSHYPPSEELLAILDEEGMYVMDETRLLSSAPRDMKVLESMVKIGRNHPSVVLYSIGNEEAQSQATKQGGRIAGTMIKAIKALDPYTPVTMALLMFDLKNKIPYHDHAVLGDIIEKLDVAGFNYHDENWAEFHRAYPDKPFICTEQGTFRSTRGCYETDADNCHLAITDKNDTSYMKGAPQWRACLPDWVSGLFIWTGFDYYGEPTPYAWPAISSQFGAFDLCGYPKDFYYYYKAWWSKEKVIHVFPDMNLKPGTKVDYYVFSNAEEVELILNGKSLGKKQMKKHDYLIWEGVTAESGEMQAVGYANGIEVMREVQKTATKKTVLSVEEEYKEGAITIRRIAVRDENGNVVPTEDHEFTIPREWGTLLGASNGDPSDHNKGKVKSIRTFKGLAQVIVSST